MKNKERKVRLINMIRSCIREEAEPIFHDLKALLEADDLDYHETCLVLFLTGEYTRISGDMSLFEQDADRIVCLQDETEEEACKPHSRMLEEEGKEGLYGENYGMAYGALYNSNLFAKREKTAKALHQMKNYAYEHYT